MALFGSARDASLIRSINQELINDFIDTEIAFYKLSLPDSQANMYDESDSKVYFGRYHSATAADARHKGNLGDMRFYKGVLTAEQVAQNYLATKNKYPNGINFTGNNISWNANGYFSFNGSNKNFATSGAPSALINATGFTVSVWL